MRACLAREQVVPDASGGVHAVLDRLVKVVKVGRVEHDVRACDVCVELLALAWEVPDDGEDVRLEVREAELVRGNNVRRTVVHEREGAQGHREWRLERCRGK